MNIIKTLILVTLITFSSQISASTRIPADDIKPVSLQISNILSNSDIIIYDEIVVTVKFKLNENNEIIIVSLDSSNKEISKFIKAQLNLKEISINKKSSNRLYSVPVRFLSNRD